MTWRDETRICALPGCGREFAPVRDNQKYCTVQHRYLANYRLSESRKRPPGHRTPREAKQKRLSAARRLYARSAEGLTDREMAARLRVSRATAWRIRRAIRPKQASAGRYRF